MKSLYILTKKCPDRHKNLDYWYLLYKYGPDIQNFNVLLTSWMKNSIKMRKFYHHAGDSCLPNRYRSFIKFINNGVSSIEQLYITFVRTFWHDIFIDIFIGILFMKFFSISYGWWELNKLWNFLELSEWQAI